MKKKKYVSLIFILILAAMFLRFTADFWTGILPECYFLRTTGYYCPGCGGTRAVISILNGRFIKAFMYNPGVVSLALIIVLAILEKITDKKILPEKLVFWVVFIIILFSFYILRNFTSHLNAL